MGLPQVGRKSISWNPREHGLRTIALILGEFRSLFVKIVFLNLDSELPPIHFHALTGDDLNYPQYGSNLIFNKIK